MSYKNIKLTFEKKHFKIENPILYAEVKENGTLILRNKSDFINVYENLLYDKSYINEDGAKISKHSFIKDWLKDPNMRTYISIDFLPMQNTPSNIYNTFRGYAGAKLQANTSNENPINIYTTKIYEHINNLCNNNKDVVDYFIKFLSRKLQHPSKLTNTSLIFRSDEGCGKDTFFNWFGNSILGSAYYLNEDKINLIFGRFNGCIENKILVIINETSGKDTIEMMSSIKNAITRNTNNIENKGMKPYDNTNNIGYICLTNNKNSMKIDSNDRRFCAIECNNDIANNSDYFNQLNTEMNEPLITRAFYDYFMSIDCSTYDFTKMRPKTDFYNSMKEYNMPPVVKFLENLVNTNLIKGVNSSIYNKFYEVFTSYLMSSMCKYDITESRFGIDLKEFTAITKKRTNKGIVYNVDYILLKEYLIIKYKIDDYNDLELVGADALKNNDTYEKPVVNDLDIIF
jgi:hypothetical protein